MKTGHIGFESSRSLAETLGRAMSFDCNDIDITYKRCMEQLFLSVPDNQTVNGKDYQIVYDHLANLSVFKSVCDVEPIEAQDSDVVDRNRKLDLRYCTKEESEDFHSLLNRTYEYIKSVNYDLYRSVRLLINFYVLAGHPHAEGGSVSSSIGVIWINPDINYSEQGLADVIVHETVHNFLFLDDMVNKIFSCDMEHLTSYKAKSAILLKERAFDKAFHAAFVLHHLITWKGSGANNGIDNKNLTASIVSMQKYKNKALTKHGLDRLSQLERIYLLEDNLLSLSA